MLYWNLNVFVYAMSEIPRNPWSFKEIANKPAVELGALAKECGVSEKEIKETMAQLGCAKPEREHGQRSRPGGVKASKSVLKCSAEDADKVRKYYRVDLEAPLDEKFEEGEVTEKKEIPEDYVSLGRLRIKLGLDKREIGSFLHEITMINVRAGTVQTPFGVLPHSGDHDEMIHERERTFISPAIARKITEWSKQIFFFFYIGNLVDADGAIRELKIVGGDQDAPEENLRREMDGFIQKYPWLAKEITEKSDRIGEPATTYYSRDLISLVRKMNQSGHDFVTAAEDVPVEYGAHSDVANDLRIFPSKLDLFIRKALADKDRLERPVIGFFQPGSSSKRITYFYSPALVKRVEKLQAEEVAARQENVGDDPEGFMSVETGEEAPLGYLSKRYCLSLLAVTAERFERLVEEVQQLHPEFAQSTVTVFKNNKSLRPRVFYSQELVKAVSELKTMKDGVIPGKEGLQSGESGAIQEVVPEGYISRETCAIDLAISVRKITQLVNECVALEPSLKTQELTVSRPGRSREVSVFYSPELVLAVGEKKRADDELRLRRIEDEQRLFEEIITLKEQLSSVLLDIERGLEETTLLRRTISLFGGARTLDILCTFYPEFKKLPVEYVKKELASYLSDYMVSRSENVIEDLEISLPFLNERVFKETLLTVLKDNCVTNYSKKKREAKERPDEDILKEYVAVLRGKAAFFKNGDFDDVIDGIEDYVTSLLNDFQKPDSIVDALGVDRKFPDLNQIINIKEVADQRRVLIGDEMGMGKSGSAILSKEYLGLNTAVVIVPSNAVDLWKGYLSDKVSPAGKQMGYFKKGQSPRVLEIQSPEDIDRAKSEEYDYVIISHDRITEECASKLRGVQYEMVIIDEAHKFKNVTDGKRSSALLDLLEDCEEEDTYTVLLSGTPIPNKIKDMAIVLKLLYPEKFGRIENNLLVTSIIKGDLVGLRELLLKRTQMKKLSESVEMPEKDEFTVYAELSEEERELYQLIMRDDQLSAMERLSALRLFCLNPQKVFPDRETRGSKVTQVEMDVADFFETKNKLVLFVNGYVSGVIRGENSVLSQMKVPEGVAVRIIDGDVSREERRRIEEELSDLSSGKILLVVNGSAVDVAVDFSAAEGVQFYNEPWTKFDKMQQTSRVYRPGLKQDITVGTSIVRDTIEEGMHYYIEMKYRAVVKLLEGIPLSELEKSLLLLDEKVSDTTAIDRDQGLSEEWLQTPMGRLNKFSQITKEMGDKEFRSGFLEEHGEAYASAYEELETHSFQANTARFVSALIDEYRSEKGLPSDITILDLASGPEMLRKRMRGEVRTNVFSLDINEEHFKERHDKQIVGGFVDLTFPDSSVDYVNLSHALHYSSFRPERGNYERLIVLSEITRVLKVGGRATINLGHTQRFKNTDALRQIADEIGLEVVDSATGIATSGEHYKSQCVTFEKIEEIDLPSTIAELKTRSRHLLYGLRLDTNVKRKLHGSQQIARSFDISGRTVEPALNEEDTHLLEEQETIQTEGTRLIQDYGGEINAIPKREMLRMGYLRYTSGKKSRLAKKGLYSQSFVYVQ